MIFPTDENWASWGVDVDAHKFVIIKWCELFDINTFDSWQFRTSNLASILDEMLQSLVVVKTVNKYHPNINSLIEEAIKISKRDLVIKEYFPFVRGYLDKLMELYCKEIKGKESASVFPLERLIKVIIGNTARYGDILKDEIKKIIASPPESYKKRLSFLLESLAVDVVREGYSIRFVLEISEVLKTNDLPFAERFDSMLLGLSGQSREYKCSFLVRYHAKVDELQDRLKESGIDLISERPIEEGVSPEATAFYASDESALIATITVNALDRYSARQESEEKLDSFFSVVKFYQPSQEPFVRKGQPVLVRDVEAGSDVEVYKNDDGFKHYKDVRVPYPHISSLMSLVSGLADGDKDQLAASLQYHKLALSASTDEARLVNMWIALESLVQDGDGTIISRVLKNVPNNISTNYVYKTVKALPHSFFIFWRSRASQDLINVLDSSSRYYLHIDDMIRILVKAYGEPVVESFLAFTSDHQLLGFRISQLWDGMFKSPKQLVKSLKSHEENVRWQLMRIYRTRNQIMHQGKGFPGTRQLLQHLHTYYNIVIRNLVFDLTKFSGWNLHDSFEHRFRLYELMIKALENHKDSPFSVDCLAAPHLLLEGNTSGDLAWPHQVGD